MIPRRQFMKRGQVVCCFWKRALLLCLPETLLNPLATGAGMTRKLRIAWAALWCVPTYFSLLLFCCLVAVVNLSIRVGLDRWEDNV